MKVEITMEKVLRVSKEVDVTENQLEQLKNGENPFKEEMEEEILDGYFDEDFAVCDLNGDVIVPWSH